MLSVPKLGNARVRNFYAYENFCDYSMPLLMLLEHAKLDEKKKKSTKRQLTTTTQETTDLWAEGVL